MNKIDGPTGPLLPRPIENPAAEDPRLPAEEPDAPPARPQQQSSGYITSEEGQARRNEVLNKLAATQAKSGGVPSYDDAYWAKQPADVQKLRTMDDISDRAALVSELMQKGYKIDVPIMLWGWGPQQTNQLRAAYGYTWVPNAAMESVKIAPGLTMPYMDSYDPNSPPPGAILIDASEMENNPFKDINKPPSSWTNPVTEAKVVAPSGQSTPVPAALLSDLAEATAMQKRLAALGYDLKVSDQQPDEGQTPKYGKETRRPYAIGGFNVGILQGWYARMREEEANQMVKDAMKNKTSA